MQKLNSKFLSRQRPMLNFFIYFVISFLYAWSLVCVGMGIVYLAIILLFGGMIVENGQLLALGIFLFFPLRYLKREWKKQTHLRPKI